jgi:HK97 family phage major capsid protein/HK97 family phage prohead protease
MPGEIEPITGPPVKLPVTVCRTQADLGELRQQGDGKMPVMEGHFSAFDNWYEINSSFEGNFLERVAPGAFKKTFNDDAGKKRAGDKIKVLLEHGHDPTVADKPLGVPRSLKEDGQGAAYEVPLLDTSYVRDLIPALDAGAYGSSFRFRVMVDEWNDQPEKSDYNPNGIPERTVKEVRVAEFGPTMYPANGDATAGLRSTTDEYYAGLKRRRPEEFADALRSAQETREQAESARSQALAERVAQERADRVNALLAAGLTTEQAEAAVERGDSGSPEEVVAGLQYAAALGELEIEYTGSRADDPKKPYGSVPYGDPGYQKDKVKRYPLDTADHVKAAWSYINQEGNGAKYSSGDLAKVKASIMAAAKKFNITIAEDQKNSTTAPPGAAGAATSRTEEPRKHSAGDSKPTGQQRSANMPAELTMTVEERQVRQQEITQRLNELDAEYRGAVLPEERQTEWDEISAEFEEHTANIAAAEARSRRIAALAGSGSTEGGTPFHAPNVIKKPENIYDLTSLRKDARSMDDLVRMTRDNALRAVEAHHYDTVEDQTGTREHIEKLLRGTDAQEGELARRILVTGTELYDRAFGKACLAINTNGLSNEERAALAVGTTTAGGFAVPFSLDPTVIMTNASVVNPIRQVARVVTITGKQWQGITSAGITVSRTAEAAESTDNSPTIAQPTATPTRVQGFVPFSFEIDQDWTQMRSELGMMFDEAKNVEEATAFTTGSGVDPNPEGFVTGIYAVGGSVVQTATSATFVTGDVYLPADGLPSRHVSGATWLANKSFYSKVRQLDQYGGSALWARIGEGRPDQLLGYPVYEASAMAAFATTANTKLAVLGDFKKFLIVDRVGMAVELIPHLFGGTANYPTGQRGLFAVWRNTSKTLDPNAFRLLKMQ